MTEKTRTCPVCHGAMVLRLGEFQCQQCGNAMPPAAPEEPKQSGGYSSPTYGSRSGGYGEIGSTLGGAPRSPRPPVAPPPPAVSDPGAQYRSAPPPLQVPPRAPAVAYAGGGTYGGTLESGGDPLALEKKIYFGLHCTWVGLITVVLLFSVPWLGAIMLVSGAIGLAILYWVLFGPELWSKWACLGCAGIGVIGTLTNMLTSSSAASLRMLPQLQGFSDHALQSYNIVTGLFSLAWSGWYISILLRDALRKQQGY